MDENKRRKENIYLFVDFIYFFFFALCHRCWLLFGDVGAAVLIGVHCIALSKAINEWKNIDLQGQEKHKDNKYNSFLFSFV